MIIVAGHLRVAPSDREKLLGLSRQAVMLARANAKCLDYVVGPDLIEADRVNIFERWASRAALEEFRASGPDDGMDSIIQSYSVDEYVV
jgi:quinol monooxygenase YgiN